ncbi:MAG: hypothetical protein JEZ04_03480 [Spirochaetales bacterium]|nr:hypothetical protein [Spirochaetales bacterium]
MIESVSMGKLLFKGKVSRSDTIVYPDHMDTKWWIKGRNCIESCDLEDVLKSRPEVVVVGLGFIMPITISDEAIETMKTAGIEVFVEKTEEAMDVYNKNTAKKKTVGLFHLL